MIPVLIVSVGRACVALSKWLHLDRVIILSLDSVKFLLPDIGFMMLHAIHKTLEE